MLLIFELRYPYTVAFRDIMTESSTESYFQRLVTLLQLPSKQGLEEMCKMHDELLLQYADDDTTSGLKESSIPLVTNSVGLRTPSSPNLQSNPRNSPLCLEQDVSLLRKLKTPVMIQPNDSPKLPQRVSSSPSLAVSEKAGTIELAGWFEGKRGSVDAASIEPHVKKMRLENEGKAKGKLRLREIDDSDSTEDVEDTVKREPFIDITDDSMPCSVCKSVFCSSGSSKSIECVECHLSFHQKCHSPEVSEAQMNDPRLVWYCGNCSKQQKKMTVHKAPPAASHSPLKQKEVKSHPPSTHPNTLQPFKRSEGIKSFGASALTTAVSKAKSPVSGSSVADLAASFLAKQKGNMKQPIAVAAKPIVPPKVVPLPAFKSSGFSNSVQSNARTQSNPDVPIPSSEKPSSSLFNLSGAPSSTKPVSCTSMQSAQNKLQTMKKNAAKQLADKKASMTKL